MITFETFILFLFAILAAYLMFMHYKFINRDYVSDLNQMLFSRSEPILSSYREFVKGVESDITYQSEQINKQLKDQRGLIESQSRTIRDQNELLEKNRSLYVDQVESLKRENKFLHDELKKTQNTLFKCQKKEARGDPDNTAE